MKDIINPPNYLHNNVYMFFLFYHFICFYCLYNCVVLICLCYHVKRNKECIYIGKCSVGVTLMTIDNSDMFLKGEKIADFSDTMLH
jgi:hypothetical protein